MDTSLVIQQLRTYCPVLQVVGGAADYAKGLETVVNPSQLPAAFVVPLADEAEDNELQNGLLQQVRERIGVTLILDNSADRRGQTSVNQIEDLKFQVFSALLNWRIDPIRAQKGLQYAGGQYVDMDRGRLFWRLEFDLLVTIDDDDGFQITGIPLTDIRVDVELEPNPEPAPATEPVEVDVFMHPPYPLPGNMSVLLTASAGSVTTSIGDNPMSAQVTASAGSVSTSIA